MTTASKPFHVRIDEEDIQGWVSRDGRACRAWGTFRGRSITERGSTESGAVDAWRKAAERVANE